MTRRAAGPADCDALRSSGRRPARIALGPITRPLHVRSLVLTAVTVTATIALALGALTLGELHIPLGRVVSSITGSTAGFEATVVTQWRLPRVVAAVVAGAALGTSGAIFQSLTRNPLGSPDVLGFSTGAYTGALVALVLLGAGWANVSIGALTGGLAAAGIVMALGGTGRSMFRLVLVGVGLSATLTAANHWLIAAADLEVAMSASMFGNGDLNGITWSRTAPLLAVVVVLGAAAGMLVRDMRVLELGDVHAAALGIRTARTRTVLMLLGLALVSLPTAVMGPVAFVALMSPNIARRLNGSHGIDPVLSGALGACLLLASDIVAQRIIAPAQLPVGLVTGCVGGLYLLHLLRPALTKGPVA